MHEPPATGNALSRATASTTSSSLLSNPKSAFVLSLLACLLACSRQLAVGGEAPATVEGGGAPSAIENEKDPRMALATLGGKQEWLPPVRRGEEEAETRTG